jgi:hypothetical protein
MKVGFIPKRRANQQTIINHPSPRKCAKKKVIHSCKVATKSQQVRILTFQLFGSLPRSKINQKKAVKQHSKLIAFKKASKQMERHLELNF